MSEVSAHGRGTPSAWNFIEYTVLTVQTRYKNTAGGHQVFGVCIIIVYNNGDKWR